LEAQKTMLAEAARRMGTPKFTALNAANLDDLDAMQANLVLAHKAAKAAIKAVRGDLPVGLSLSMFDDQAIGRNSLRDAKRRELYGNWLETARADDFLGVQNYERNMWSDKGKLPPPKGAPLNYSGAEVYAPSLAGAVRYAHQASGVPIFVTEHGVGAADDSIRARFIPAALAELQKTMASGVPVMGYCHWSLIDNFEWIFGYRPKFGLHSVDPTTFARIPKPSAAVYGAIARANAI
jgi:beta-glucosidase